MRVIPPLPITDAILTSSTVSEPGSGETAYNAGTTYAAGDTVSVIAADSHKVYTSLSAGNIGHAPAASPTYWLDSGSTNRWRMFDVLRNTASSVASPLTVVLTPGVRLNSIALLGIVADTVTISVTSGGATVYSATTNMSLRLIYNWYDYFFEPFSARETLTTFDIPPYTNAIITITMTRAVGNVSCGSCVLGTYVDLGATQYAAESDVLNFSTISRDEYGNSILVPRRNVPKTRQTTRLDKARVNKVRVLRDLLNAEPAVWLGVDETSGDYSDALTILGIYKIFTINVAEPQNALLTIELEEV